MARTNFRRNVIIPNYTIAFRPHKRRPLGIAYAQFDSIEEAQDAVRKLHGAKYRNRKISVHIHEPYDPAGRKPTVQLSHEYLWIPKVGRDVDDGAVREFFSAYSPKEVYIFNEAVTRGQRWLAPKRSNSVLVKVECENSLDSIVDALKGTKLGASVVDIKPASESKVKIVIKKAQEAATEDKPGSAEEAAAEPTGELAAECTQEVAETESTQELSVQSPELLAGINIAAKSPATEPVVTQN